MPSERTIRVDRQTGVVLGDPVGHSSIDCPRCQSGDRNHALLDWEDALEVRISDPEPRYGPPLLMGLALGLILGWVLF